MKTDAATVELVLQAMTPEDKASPGSLRPGDWRRIAADAGAHVQGSHVQDVVHHHAMIRTMMVRVRKALMSGASMPTSTESFKQIVQGEKIERDKERDR